MDQIRDRDEVARIGVSEPVDHFAVFVGLTREAVMVAGAT
jgi:hypothetical protein